MAAEPPANQRDVEPASPSVPPEPPPYKYEPTYQPGPYPAGPYPYGYQPYNQEPPRRGIGWLAITVILLGLVLVLIGLFAVFYLGIFAPAAV